MGYSLQIMGLPNKLDWVHDRTTSGSLLKSTTLKGSPFMRCWLTFLLFGLIVLSGPTTARTQKADAQYFESIDGLERIVGRAWVAPVVMGASTRQRHPPCHPVHCHAEFGTSV